MQANPRPQVSPWQDLALREKQARLKLVAELDQAMAANQRWAARAQARQDVQDALEADLCQVEADRDRLERERDANRDSALAWKAEAERRGPPPAQAVPPVRPEAPPVQKEPSMVKKAMATAFAEATWWRKPWVWITGVIGSLGLLFLGLILLAALSAGTWAVVTVTAPEAVLPVAFEQSRSWTVVGGQKVTLTSSAPKRTQYHIALHGNGQVSPKKTQDITIGPGTEYELSWKNFRGMSAGDELHVTSPNLKGTAIYTVQ